MAHKGRKSDVGHIVQPQAQRQALTAVAVQPGSCGRSCSRARLYYWRLYKSGFRSSNVFDIAGVCGEELALNIAQLAAEGGFKAT